MTPRPLCYHELHNSLLRIKKNFAASVRPDARDSDLLAGDAYLVAAHAAVEYFFEDLCRRALHMSLWRYRRSRVTPSILAAVVDSRYKVAVGALPRGGLNASASPEEEIKDAVVWMVKRIDTNQGVKKANLLALLLPLGFSEADFDPVWLASMDSFGALRGDTAHGRPATNFGKPSVNIAPSGRGSVDVAVWTQGATRTRTTYAPWDVDQTLSNLTPEMLAWDLKVRARV